MTVHASTKATRTLLGDNHSVAWSERDSFRLFGDGDLTGQSFLLAEGAGTASGTFTGSRPSGSSFVALYPERYAEMTSAGPVVTLPASQRYVAGSFASGSNPMIDSHGEHRRGSLHRSSDLFLCGRSGSDLPASNDQDDRCHGQCDRAYGRLRDRRITRPYRAPHGTEDGGSDQTTYRKNQGARRAERAFRHGGFLRYGCDALRRLL